MSLDLDELIKHRLDLFKREEAKHSKLKEQLKYFAEEIAFLDPPQLRAAAKEFLVQEIDRIVKEFRE